MDTDFLEERIKDCIESMQNLETLDFYNYNNAKRRVFNQRCVNKAYDIIFKIKKQLEYKKIRLEREVANLDLDKEELEETRKINGVISRKYVEENYIKKEKIEEELRKLYDKKLSDDSREDIETLYKIEILEDILQK